MGSKDKVVLALFGWSLKPLMLTLKMFEKAYLNSKLPFLKTRKYVNLPMTSSTVGLLLEFDLQRNKLTFTSKLRSTFEPNLQAISHCVRVLTSMNVYLLPLNTISSKLDIV